MKKMFRSGRTNRLMAGPLMGPGPRPGTPNGASLLPTGALNAVDGVMLRCYFPSPSSSNAPSLRLACLAFLPSRSCGGSRRLHKTANRLRLRRGGAMYSSASGFELGNESADVSMGAVINEPVAPVQRRGRRDFESIDKCSTEGRSQQTAVSDLDGTLLRSNSSFPYFMLVAFEGSGIIRSWLLLILAPLAWLLYHHVSEASGIRLLIFVAFAGLRVKEIESIARAVLPKFYAEDVHNEAWKVFGSFQKRMLLTANPRIMVEPFAKDYLGVEKVIGTEVQVTRFWGQEYCTGFLKYPGVMVGRNKEAALRAAIGDTVPDVGLGDRPTDFPFMSMCKEGYLVRNAKDGDAAPKSSLCKTMYFHDGRLVRRPDPPVALRTLCWLPIGFMLAMLRILIATHVPRSWVPSVYKVLGIRLSVKGTLPPPVKGGKGILFVCTHRTLLDPVFLSVALGRHVTAVTYSISRVSEVLSPIRTVPLTRNKEMDAANIQKLLTEGDVAICPEGTTCREPFLLRFSALFAELSDQIVPVAMTNRQSMFHATTARGWKGMDPFFFFMNPTPTYEVTFLDKLSAAQLTGAKYIDAEGNESQMTSIDVANNVQKLLAAALGFECTKLTRKEKYNALVGTDGFVSDKPRWKMGRIVGS